MLVLSRQRNESVIIGKRIKVQVADIRREKVILGFEAPDGVTVHRAEIYGEIYRHPPRYKMPDGENVELVHEVPPDVDKNVLVVNDSGHYKLVEYANLILVAP